MLCYENESSEEKKEKAIRFANNVIEYLFSSVAKFDAKLLFDSNFDRYQKVYDRIVEFSFDADQSQEFISMLASKVADDFK